MTHRDFAWRGVGLALIGAAVTTRLADWYGMASVSGLAGLTMALAGTVLLVQGKRVPAALRVELSRHRTLPQAIHRRRRNSRTDDV